MFEARRSSISVLSDGQPRSKNASMSTPLPLELLQAWRVAKRKPSDAHEAVIHTWCCEITFTLCKRDKAR
jgi:hypothetical protein